MGTISLEQLILIVKTNESYLIPVPDVTLTIDNNINKIPSPELDLGTQLRECFY
jgi:hypothetical protein